MDAAKRSALGDWSGIKGTHYHLLYALYLLVCKRVPRLWFYRGSDVLAQPAPPPPDGSQEASLGVNRGDRQIWVQAKNTEERWTAGAILREVLPNLAIAALSSEDEGRVWQAEVATPGDIATKDLEEFINEPQDFSRLNGWFEEAVDAVASSRDNLPSAADTERVRTICVDVLTQIARCRRLSIGEVREALLRELTDQHGSSARAEAMLLQLLGQLLEDAGEGTAGPYALDWLDQTAGVDVLPRGAFDISVRDACDEHIGRALRLLPEWDPDVCISRDEFIEAVDRFIASSEPVFVLVGSTDAGKSWALADYARRHLVNQVRCVRTGDDLLEAGSLAELVGSAFSPLTKSGRDIAAICDAWRGEALANQQHPVLVVDEIASSGDDEKLQRKLHLFAVDAAGRDIKLILGINEAVFHGNQPVAKIDDRAIYSPAGSEGKVSHRLSGLTKDELRRLAKRVVPSAEISRVVAEAETIDPHAKESVRIATYLLRLLSQGHSEAATQKAAELLAEMLQQRISRIASGITPLSEEEVYALVREALADAWRAGREGVTRRELINIAERYGAESPATLVPQLQRHGLLTVTMPFRPTGNSLAGLLIAQAIRDGEDLEWVQSLDSGSSLEPLFFWALAGDKFSPDTARAIRLRHRQVGEPICRGLAQRRDVTQDHFLLLLQWGRGDGRVVAFPPACEAVGRIVDRCPAARDWVETAYTSPNSWVRARAEIALSAALSVDPDWAVEQVRRRLADEMVDKQGKDRQRWVRDAMRPLKYAPPTVATENVEQLLADVQRWAEEVPDTFIGLRARWGGYEDVSALGGLRQELRSDDRIERLTAAEAAFIFSEHNPGAAAEILGEAIASERDDYVLTRLVRALFHLTGRPEEVVQCLMGTSATDPTEFAGATGIACAILARITDTHAREVATLLPASLDDVHPTYAAQLWEGLAYAWWRVAEQLPTMTDRLARLTQPTALGTFDEGTHCDRGFTVFVHRGMAVASLGMAALTTSECRTGGSIKNFFYRMDVSPGLAAHLTPYLREHASHLSATDSIDEVLSTYLEVLRLYEPTRIHPIQRAWANIQFDCVQHSAEDVAMLLLPHLGDADLLEPIPEDWQRLRAARVIFTETNASEAARELLRGECDRVAGQASLQGGEERSEGLAMLAAHTDAPVRFYVDEKAASPLEGPRHNARIVGRLMDSHPERTVQLLHELLSEPTDLAALYEWCHEPTRFQPYVLSDIVHRSFDPTPLSKDDALDLCRRTVDASRACSGREAEEWSRVYAALLNSAKGAEVKTPTLLRGSSLWTGSHHHALDLLDAEAEDDDALVGWLGSHMSAHIVDHDHVRHENDSVNWGFGVSANHLTFVFPAIRIALVACGDGGDPTATWFGRREQVRQALDRWKSATDPRLRPSPERMRAAVTELKTLVSSSWWDMRLVEALATMYLRLGDPAKALWMLNHADRIRGLPDQTAAAVHYNRACAHAKLRQCEQASYNLNRAADLGWQETDWAKQDPDFISVRGMPWFRSVVARAGQQRRGMARSNLGPKGLHKRRRSNPRSEGDPLGRLLLRPATAISRP